MASSARTGGIRRSGWRRRFIAGIVAASVLASCKTLEEFAPILVIAGGAIATVATLNHFDDPNYAVAVTGLMGSLTSLGVGVADSYVQYRRRQREIRELEEIETAIEGEYAAMEEDAPGGAESWSSAERREEPSAGWTSATPTASGGVQAEPAPSPDPWGGRYPSDEELPQPGGATAPRGPSEDVLSLEVALIGREDEGLVALGDDAVLYDGIDDEQEADELRVYFRPSDAAWVYVVAVDAVGRVQPLFPQSFPDTTNPVPGGRPVLLPNDSEWYGLDRYAGLQHVYFYASSERDHELEDRLATFAANPKPEPSGDVYTVSEATIIETPLVQARGLTNTRPEVVAEIGGEGSRPDVKALVYTAPAPGEGVVVTRVFEHR